MANVTIDGLTDKPTPLSTDQIELQATAAGLSNKATIANLTKGLSVATPSAQGVMSAADKTKLDSIAPSATAYTDEMAQDAVGVMVDATLVYNDATPLLQRAALTGDVTASAGSNALSVSNDVITNAKLANVPTATFKGRTTAGTGDPEDLTSAQATALLAVATQSLQGVMSAADKISLDNLDSTAFINAVIFG